MDNLRFVLFVLFLFLSFQIYEQWQRDYGPKPPEAVAVNPDGTPAAVPSTDAAATPSAKPSAEVNGGKRITVVTDTVRAEIDTLGGDLKILDLTHYPVDKDKPDQPVRLLNDGAAELFISQSGLLGKEDSSPNHYSEWTVASTQFALADGQDELRVPLTWTNSAGVKVTKTYVFHRGSYVVDLEHQVSNQSAAAWRGQQYTQLQRKEPVKKATSVFSTSSADRAYIGGVIYTPEDKYQKVKFDEMEEKNLSRKAKDGWVAMIQHYFFAAWLPQSGEEESFYTKSLGDRVFVIGAMTPPADVQPGGQAVFKARLFAGPKLQRVLETTAPGLELTVDYGNLTFIAKPVFWLMEQFNRLFNNWGVAIILGTVVIKLLFYKLSESSYRSMANMRKLQPKLKELKERYGDDKQQFNVAMMDLYRKEKVNPLGGCLPILVQIPVFISLYWVLIESVEMRQASFALWLNDLSSMDPYFVLPAIMGVSMFIQQKLNPAPADPMQAKIMQWFPLMFTFMFAFFPSGLVLYWVVNNILSIVQQWVITRQVEGKGKAKPA
jgi:YidC/Oxa1 family membrane protein insertase